jgi:hypothetical protein
VPVKIPGRTSGHVGQDVAVVERPAARWTAFSSSIKPSGNDK